MEELELPPLPEPHVNNVAQLEDENWHSFTADQMHEYARSYAVQAVLAERERCARIVGTLNVAGAYGLRDKLAAAIRKGTT